MRLLFLCSSLESGRDGVGDYTRLLAGICTRLGHPSAIAAVNDLFVTAPILSPDRLRLPPCLSWPERIREVAAFRENFRPDWVSLQLVPYAFQKRGVLLGLKETFRELVGGLPLHLMLHELWIGAGRGSSLRHRVTGFFQRRGLRDLLRTLQPRVVTTSNPVYIAMLRELGTAATVLPLFGNVPIAPGDAWPAIHEPLARLGLTPENRAQWWIGLFFGGLHPEWQAEPFLSVLQAAAVRAGRKICLVLAGRAGAAGDVIWRGMETAYPAVRFLRLGELPAATISAWLREADFGIAASPWQLIGKSGSAAAMLDHGLPVIVTRDDFQPLARGDRAPSDDPLFYRLDATLEDKLAAGLPKSVPHARVEDIARNLLAALENAA